MTQPRDAPPSPSPADDPTGEADLVLRTAESLLEVPAAAWDACAGSANPFVSHAFLGALEESGSVRAETGWLPRHLLLERPDGTLIGAVPLYLKGHSYGEYVFDHAWADAYERAGGRYYPKLQSSVPFTPATGPRLLVAPGEPRETVRRALVAGLERVAEQLGIVTAHVTFPDEAEAEALGAAGWLRRTGQQFHWHNRGYADFEAFLAALSSRKRKAIRKERRDVAEAGVTLRLLTGGDLTEAHWDAFFAFYTDTSSRKWGMPYLNRRFFSLIGERMPERIALVMAERDGRWIAGALNLIGDDALYGRNWGCLETIPGLHFEACYYQAIDFAIARGLARVEAGAQGAHKLQRGYLPVETHSAHLIRDPALAQAVERFLVQERRAVARENALLAQEASPFRQGD